MDATSANGGRPGRAGVAAPVMGRQHPVSNDSGSNGTRFMTRLDGRLHAPGGSAVWADGIRSRVIAGKRNESVTLFMRRPVATSSHGGLLCGSAGLPSSSGFGSAGRDYPTFRWHVFIRRLPELDGILVTCSPWSGQSAKCPGLSPMNDLTSSIRNARSLRCNLLWLRTRVAEQSGASANHSVRAPICPALCCPPIYSSELPPIPILTLALTSEPLELFQDRRSGGSRAGTEDCAVAGVWAGFDQRWPNLRCADSGEPDGRGFL